MANKKTTSTNSSSKSTANAKTTRGGTGARSSKPASSARKPAANPRKPAARSKKPAFNLNLPQKAILTGIVVVFITAVLVLSLLSPNQGQLTAALSGLLGRAFGWGGALVPLITGALGMYLVLWGMEQPPRIATYRVAGFGVLFLTFAAFASLAQLLMNNGFNDFWQVAQAQTGGGYLGGIIGYGLTELAGTPGAILILVAAGVIGAVLLFGLSRHDLVNLWRMLPGLWPQPDETEDETAVRPDIPINTGQKQGQTLSRAAAPPRQLPLPDLPPTTAVTTPKRDPVPIRQPQRPAPQTASPAKPAAAPANVGSAVPFVGDMAAAGAGHWTLPILADMLEPGSDQDLSNAAIRENVEIIEHTLESFGAPATVVEINRGPTITQFGVEPNYLEMRGGKRTKVKVGKIAGLADDLALALQARSIRIQAPVPGKGYVGIEVPNTAKALVSLRDVMESENFGKIARKSPLAVGLGQDVAGQPIAADLAAMPHLLIAGTTGSGKSVCVNSIIANLLLLNTPDDLKLVMVDPKRVELTGYNGVPHLAAPVVVEMDRVIGTLQWAMREMDNRYKMFADVGARNIVDFNKKIRKNKDSKKLPYIVIIIDELADLMMLSPEDTERGITRLAQMARATGIHMIIATQRPSVDVVTGIIKANFPARIAFAVASSTDSRVILDTTGAERLLGQGDMLFQSPDAAAPARLQGCFVSDKELGGIIAYWQRARRFSTITAEEAAIPRAVVIPASPTVAPPTVAPPTAAPPTAAPPTAAPPTAAPPTATPPTAVRSSAPSPAHTPLAVAPTPIVAGNAATGNAPPKTAPRPQDTQPRPARSAPAKVEEPQRPLWEELQAIEEENKFKQQYEDELMAEAIEMVRQLNKASTSLLQRRFRIGYTRAARLIDAMEELGVIGPPTGNSKAREVQPRESGEA
ncbi:MAG: DNA translocase FtsK 4TM domain-containing protein [Chloroflexi bacterium]|nr:DNA translocase FtsK 4TM domain-containing protein [Chloroflexota bacterium]